MNKINIKLGYLLVLIVAILPLTKAVAQDNFEDDDDGIATLFGNKNVQSGGYGAFEFKLSSIDDSLAMRIGGRGAWSINHSFAIGAGGYVLIPTKKIDNSILLDIDSLILPNNEQRYVIGGYGGLFIEYSIMPKSVVHFSVNCLIGAGVVTDIASLYNYNDSEGVRSIERDLPYSIFFVAEPGVAVELNVAKWFRLGLEVSYRIAPNSDLTYIESGVEKSIMKEGAFDGLSVGLAFKFGKF